MENSHCLLKSLCFPPVTVSLSSDCYTEKRYPCCLVCFGSALNGENQDKENRPKTAWIFWFFSSVSRAETTVKVYDGFDLIKGKDNTPECSSTSTSSPSAPIIADNNKEVQRAFGAKIFEGLSVHLDLTSSFFRDSIPVSSYQIAETYPTHELLSVLIILVLRSYLCPKHNGCKQGKQKSLKRYHQGHIFFF